MNDCQMNRGGRRKIEDRKTEKIMLVDINFGSKVNFFVFLWRLINVPFPQIV